MTWFAAHIVIGIRRRDGIGVISIYENVVLIEAPKAKDARLVASKIGEAETKIDDDLTIDDFPAERLFAGIRKLVNISNPDPLDLDQDRPISGSEITYSEFEVADETAMYQFARGETIDVRYIE